MRHLPDNAPATNLSCAPSKSVSVPAVAAQQSSHRSEGMLLAGLYLVTALLHIVMLWRAFEFPTLCTDAVVYVSLSESIRHGAGYLARGVFNSSSPPLYPIFLSVLHSLGSNPRAAAFVGSCFAISLSVFPCYWLARRVGLDQPTSFLMAAAGGFLPHTLYAAIYMTETLQLPLFLSGCYFAYLWLADSSRKNSVILGLLLGALLLNKVASFVFLFALLIAVIPKSILDWRRGPVQRTLTLRACGTLFGVMLLCFGPWYVYKCLKGVSLLGTYGTTLHDQGLPFFSLSLTSVYIADYFLAAGLITVGPLIYYFYRRCRFEPYATMFFAALFIIQILWTGIVDGGLTGMLRERLMSSSMPLAAILAVRGVVELRDTGSRPWRLAVIALPLLLLGVVYLYGFHEPSAVEFPWAYSLGAVVLGGLGAFVKTRMLIVSALGVSAMLAACCWWRRKTAGRVVAGGILVFHLVTFGTVSVLLGSGTVTAMAIIGPMKDWLVRSGAGFEQPILVASAPAHYEDRPPNLQQEGVFEECSGGRRIDPITLWQMETYLRWNARTVCGPADIGNYGHSGELLLTAHEVDGTTFVSRFGPYSLYRLGRDAAIANASAPAPTDLLGYVYLPKPGAQRKECMVGGWAFCRRGAVEDILVYLDGVYVMPAAKNGRRPDVAAAFPHDRLAGTSGFYSLLDLSKAEAGKHTVAVKIRTDNGEVRLLGKEVEIEVVK